MKEYILCTQLRHSNYYSSLTVGGFAPADSERSESLITIMN